MMMQDKLNRIVIKMREKDTYLQWLNPVLMDVKEGVCKITIDIRKEFLNHVGIVHGGITFGLADAAFAYASNSHNRVAVALDVSISYTEAVYEGDQLTALAKEEYIGNKTAIYKVEVFNQYNKLVAIFNGTVYRKKELHEAEE